MELNRKGILFAHVPKTAGTSFRKSTESYAKKWQVYSDYGVESPTNSEIINSFYEADDFSGLAEINGQKTMLSGHYLITRHLPFYPIQNVVSFLRDPVQRVISHYHDLQERIDYPHSLEDFIKERRYQNTQSRYFAGVPVQAVGFIGISEFYKDSLELIRHLYGLKLPVRQMNRNSRKKNDFYFVSGKTTQLIRKNNRQDFLLYRKALNLFLLRRFFERQGKHYVHGLVNPVEDNQIFGWAYNFRSDRPVILELLVNGEMHEKREASDEMPELKKLNFPRKGEVGYMFRPKARLQNTDRIEVRVVGTGQVISRG